MTTSTDTAANTTTTTATPTGADPWRRRSTKEFTLLALLTALVVVAVHQTTLSRETAQLPMERVLSELEATCPPAVGPDGDFAATELSLPPAFFGLGVWVDSPALLPGVHAALVLMKERLAGGVGSDPSVAFSPPTHSLHSFVRLHSKTRDVAVAELLEASLAAGGDVSSEQVMRRMELLASQQQLGMPTMKHAFLPQIGQEVELQGLSLFSVPATLLPEGSKVSCFIADVRQAYCVFPVDKEEDSVSHEEKGQEAQEASEEQGGMSAAAEAKKSPASSAASSISATVYRTRADTLEAEIRAALLSVVTQQLGLPSFKPADVAAWKQAREHQGCSYTISSVRSTLRSIEANTNMVIPLETEHMFADLEQYVRAKAFVRAARAADDLQFHPSLTPQLYIPWDHAIVSQLVILLPAVSISILAVRFVVDDRRAKRAQAAKAVADGKKDQ